MANSPKMNPKISIDDLGQSPVKAGKKVTINEDGKQKSVSRLSGGVESVKTDGRSKRKSAENLKDKKGKLKQDSILAGSTEKVIDKNEPQIASSAAGAVTASPEFMEEMMRKLEKQMEVKMRKEMEEKFTM